MTNPDCPKCYGTGMQPSASYDGKPQVPCDCTDTLERELQVIKNRALALEDERDAARAEAERLRKAAEAVLEHACWFARKTPMAGNAIVSNLPQLRAALDGEGDPTQPAAAPTPAPRPK